MTQPSQSNSRNDDATWSLLAAAKSLVREAYGRLADPNAEHITTALVLEAEDAVNEALSRRACDVEGGTIPDDREWRSVVEPR